MTRGEAHGDRPGGYLVGREAAPRGVRDQTGEMFRVAASVAEQAASQ